MSPLNQFKRFEKKVAQQVKKGVWRIYRQTLDFLLYCWQLGRQNFTIMLIPHSEKKIISFKISVFAMVFIGILGLLMVGVSWWFSTHYTALNRHYAQKSTALETSQASLDMVREEVGQLHRVATQFKESLNTTLNAMGKDLPLDEFETQAGGDISALLHLQQLDPGAIREVGDLKGLRAYLQKTTKPVVQINNVLSAQRSILVDIPTLWPLKSRGWVTNPFGPCVHPFTGQWYLHKGIDLADKLGTPVIATANGKVIKVDYDILGYGNYINLKHNFGFNTKYGHLSRIYVTKGQDILRGQVIGAIGSTGLSTGPHLHYEIYIGTQLVDPSPYLNIPSYIFDKEE